MRCILPCALALLLTLACGAEPETPPPPATVVPEPPSPAPPPPVVRAGPLCTYHGVCWAGPLPQGNALHAVRALAADRVVAVGDRGTVLAWNGSTWSFEDTPTRERLLDVAGTAGDLFAVGESGTILHRDAGGSWTAMTSGIEATLRAVVVIAANDVVASGDGALVLHFDGTAWTREALPQGVPADMNVVALARHDATTFALGARTVGDEADRAVLARSDGAWRSLSSIAGDVGAIAVTPDGSLVLSGESARHGDGTTWRVRSFGSDRPLDALWSAAADDVWAGGYDGRLAHWDGRAWHHEQLGGADAALDIDDLDGTSATDLWAVGEHGLIAHRDGAAWTIVSSGTRARLEGVAGLGRDDVWAVGDHVALHWDGHAWSTSGPSDVELEQIAVANGTLFAVGGDGAIRRFAEGTWTSETSSTSAKLEGVWASDGTHAIAVGAEWTQRDGSAWHVVADRPAATGVWGASESSVWAATGEGLAHWDGATWTPDPSTASTPMIGVWGTAENDVWAVGPSGVVLHFDGTRWSPTESDTTQDLLHVWGRSASDVWAVGVHGTLLHWDGTRWRWRDAGTDEVLHSVWGTPDGEVWIVGHGGVVLRMDEP